jgi:hypothetical protein
MRLAGAHIARHVRTAHPGGALPPVELRARVGKQQQHAPLYTATHTAIDATQADTFGDAKPTQKRRVVKLTDSRAQLPHARAP